MFQHGRALVRRKRLCGDAAVEFLLMPPSHSPQRVRRLVDGRHRVAVGGDVQRKLGTHEAGRHSFVSLLSSAGIPIEDIAHLVSHANTRTTEKVYRKELRPVLRRGAKAMDDLFKTHQKASEPPNLPPAFTENQTER